MPAREGTGSGKGPLQQPDEHLQVPPLAARVHAMWDDVVLVEKLTSPP